jgi:hypothetical protein
MLARVLLYEVEAENEVSWPPMEAPAAKLETKHWALPLGSAKKPKANVRPPHGTENPDATAYMLVL